MNKTYLLSIALFLIPAAGLFGLNYLYLRNTGEFLSLQEIVERQQTGSGFCIYGSALHQDTIPYKLAGYAARLPQVTVIGSSLTLQYRERFFRGPFFSLSGTMDNTANGALLPSLLLAQHKPDLLLLGTDVWWFQQDVSPYRRTHLDLSDADRFTLEKVAQPFSWLLQGKISLTEYLRTALRGAPESGPCGIGVFAQERRRGSGPDGSYYYTSAITGEDLQGTSPGFLGQLDEIRENRGHFVYGTGVSQQSMDDFVHMVKELEDAGVTVVPILEPFAPKVFAEMQRHPDAYRYIDALREEFRARGIAVFDFLDPRSIGASDCEFIDGIHMGDVASARLLRALYNSSRDPHVRSLINTQEIDATIKSNAGFAMAKDQRVTNMPETDFLAIGCPKIPR